MGRSSLIVAAALAGVSAGCGGNQETGEADAASTSACQALRNAVVLPVDGFDYLVYPRDTNGDCATDLWRLYDVVDDDGNVLIGAAAYRDPANSRIVHSNRRIRQQWLDLNLDGYVDVVRYYDALERLERVEYDTNYDQNIDLSETYAEGRLVSRSVDTQGDDTTDVFRYYRDQEVFRIEVDTDGDGVKDAWHFYDSDGLARIGRDTDGDGDIDTWERRSMVRTSGSASPDGPTAPEGSGDE
ncbi:MAG: hypothetical protein H6698_01415 [Myxococcales bacterium]|nr:hypothetical protein [Myxococcales bacterium]MCB9531058.1 hypothetical protein [Myxococcales bacterium]MCB9532968.1 hypothetical protein [Myxococcales bacterium]